MIIVARPLSQSACEPIDWVVVGLLYIRKLRCIAAVCRISASEWASEWWVSMNVRNFSPPARDEAKTPTDDGSDRDLLCSARLGSAPGHEENVSVRPSVRQSGFECAPSRRPCVRTYVCMCVWTSTYVRMYVSTAIPVDENALTSSTDVDDDEVYDILQVQSQCSKVSEWTDGWIERLLSFLASQLRFVALAVGAHHHHLHTYTRTHSLTHETRQDIKVLPKRLQTELR